MRARERMYFRIIHVFLVFLLVVVFSSFLRRREKAPIDFEKQGRYFWKSPTFLEKSPTFFEKRPRNVGKTPTFFELSPSEDFEEGMFSKKDEYYLVGKPYFCSSRGGANGVFGSVLTRKSWVSALVVPHIIPKRFSYSSSCRNSSFKA